uniref:Spx/MgsR family RNA polymerase-binding regulatory protein n=1 Tax=Ningiella ruwaisensis TaxID=2364274 RepID=UPI00109FA4EE|nr:Spx/MgsR family RNA polymerase-binding regulatory protein [Ningiella ruwaisensis]
MTHLYGINNCDTVKKAKTWLNDKQVNYQFHDYKKEGVDLDFIRQMLETHGVAVIVNKRGTTYRKLDDAQKSTIDSGDINAVALLLQANSSMIKRPIALRDNASIVGFKADEYADFFQ